MRKVLLSVTFTLLGAIAINVNSACIAQAGTIITSFTPYTAAIPFDPAGTDQPGTNATLSGGGWAGNVVNLNDGAPGQISIPECGLSPGDFVTYDFDLANAPLGWDISQVVSYVAWDSSLGGRSRQGYSITATLMNDSTVEVMPAQIYIDGTDIVATKVDIAIQGLTGVKSLLFADFVVAPSDPVLGNIYSEIDVFGAATVVPEPSTIVLLLSVFASLAIFRRVR